MQDVAFDPNDHAAHGARDLGHEGLPIHRLGRHLEPGHDELASPRPASGSRGSITYNPGGSEVWIDSFAATGGIFKCAGRRPSRAGRTCRQSPGQGSSIPRVHQCQLGLHPAVPLHRRRHELGLVRPLALVWLRLGHLRPDRSPDSCYIENDAVGVQKTTDGGHDLAEQGRGIDRPELHLDGRLSEPIRCGSTRRSTARWGSIAAMTAPAHWTFLPIAGSCERASGPADPFDSQRVYVGADSGFYASTDGGDSWTGTGWNLPPSSPSGLFVTMAADPYHAGHLLASFGGGTYGVGPGWLYSSTDYGASWQAVDVNPGSACSGSTASPLTRRRRGRSTSRPTASTRAPTAARPGSGSTTRSSRTWPPPTTSPSPLIPSTCCSSGRWSRSIPTARLTAARPGRGRRAAQRPLALHVRRRRLHPPVCRLLAGTVLLERRGRFVGASGGGHRPGPDHGGGLRRRGWPHDPLCGDERWQRGNDRRHDGRDAPGRLLPARPPRWSTRGSTATSW